MVNEKKGAFLLRIRTICKKLKTDEQQDPKIICH